MSRILVADDDAAIRRMLERTLVREGYAVSTASNGREALDQIHAAPPDLLLLDLMMPVLDGWAVYRELHREGAALPIIIITAGEQASLVHQDLPGSDVLPKPFELDELLSMIQDRLP
jgi:two-component system response regulator MprA